MGESHQAGTASPQENSQYCPVQHAPKLGNRLWDDCMHPHFYLDLLPPPPSKPGGSSIPLYPTSFSCSLSLTHPPLSPFISLGSTRSWARQGSTWVQGWAGLTFYSPATSHPYQQL